MTLLSPAEYKAKKGQPVTTPTVPSAHKTLMSPAEYKASIAAVQSPAPTPAVVPTPTSSVTNMPQPFLNQRMQPATPEPKKPGLLQKLGKAAGTVFNDVIAKPASSVTATVADVGGELNNLFAKKQVGYNGEKIQPSQSRNLIKDLAAIWTQSGSGADVAHQAMVGAVPNDFLQNRTLPGTNLTLGGLEEGLLQNFSPIPGAGAVKKGVTVAKDLNDARNLGKAAKDFIQRTKTVTEADTAATQAGAARSGLVQDVGELPQAAQAQKLAPESVKPVSGLMSPTEYKKSLHADAEPEPQPIKLTPEEIARQKRIDEFSVEEDNPEIPDTSKQIQSKTTKERTSVSLVANNAYIKGVDNLHRVNQFDKAVSEVMEKDLKPSSSAYKLALNSRGSDMITRQILERNLVDSRGNIIGDSLKAVAEQIPQKKWNDFDNYLIAKHSITRMGRGEKVYKDNLKMTIQKAKIIVKSYEDANPEFKTAAQAYYKYNRQLGQSWLVDTGLLSQEQWDGYLERNPHYVPNNRIFTDLEKQQQFGSKRSFGNQSNPIKPAPGSQRQIVPTIESTIENTAKYVNTAKKNEVAQALYRNIQKDPESFDGWAEIVEGEKKDVAQQLDEDGVEGLLDDIEKSYTQKPDLTKGNIVSVLIDGERKYMRINDPQLLEALTNLNPRGQDYVTKVMGKATNIMKNLTTGINPVFGLVRNIARDIPHAYIASKSTMNPIRFGVDLLDAVTSVLADSTAHSAPKFMRGWLETRGRLYNEYKNVGGGHASPAAADRNLLAQSKERLLPSKGVMQSIKRPFAKGLRALENLNNAVEAAPRLGEFKRLSKPGTYDSKVNALYESNDLTTNFKKYGNVTKNADAYLPYLNAAMQGLDQLVRMGTQGGAKRLAQVYSKAVFTLTLPTVVLYLINHNNPDYQQLSNYTKDNYMLIPKGDGTFIKIAKPRELGDVFSTAVERSLRAFADDDPDAFQGFSHDFLQNFLPPGASGIAQGIEEGGATGALTGLLGDTILGSVASLASNRDFANRPIVPGDLADLSPRLQYDSKTSAVAKYLGDKLNASPKQLDYLLRSYGGVIGQLGIPATAPGSGIRDTLNQQITADPVFSNDAGTNFYNAKAKADRAKADQDQTGERVPAAAYQKYYDRMARVIAQIRAQSKIVQNDPNIPAKEKAAKLRALQQQMNELEKSSLIK